MVKGTLAIGFCIFVACAELGAQVKVSGIVKDAETGRGLAHAFVINHRTQNGVFCDNGGKFNIETKTNDSLLISLTGYQFTKVLLSDSMAKSSYFVEVKLKVKPIALRPFVVKAPKTFEQIITDLAKAEQLKPEATPLVNAVESPITFLYDQFSKEGKARKKIAELRAEDAKMELLRELFTRYMVAKIIDTDENELDDFIRFSGLKNQYTTFDTEYELVTYIKQRWADYKEYRGFGE
jgi:hypothetical protein